MANIKADPLNPVVYWTFISLYKARGDWIVEIISFIHTNQTGLTSTSCR
jgi:hypothetical protein